MHLLEIGIMGESEIQEAGHSLEIPIKIYICAWAEKKEKRKVYLWSLNQPYIFILTLNIFIRKNT